MARKRLLSHIKTAFSSIPLRITAIAAFSLSLSSSRSPFPPLALPFLLSLSLSLVLPLYLFLNLVTMDMDMGMGDSPSHACKVSPCATLDAHIHLLIFPSDIYVVELVHSRFLLPLNAVAHSLRRQVTHGNPSLSFVLSCPRYPGAFAGSVIAVFIITALVEGVRRASREYDRQIVLQAQQRLKFTDTVRLTADASSGKAGVSGYLFISVVPPCRIVDGSLRSS
jgi:hypothetical protein